MMKDILKNFLVNLFRRIHSVLRLDVLSKEELIGQLGPITKLKLAKRSLHQLPFSNGLTVRGCAFNHRDPFCRALSRDQSRAAINSEKFSAVILDVLRDERDKTIRDFLPEASGFIYSQYPIYSLAFPWDLHTFDTFSKEYIAMVLENRQEYTNIEKELLTEEFIYSQGYIDSHVVQFNSLLSSIERNGFDSNGERPKVIILKTSNHWKWLMSGQGNHRAYLLWMLNYEGLPCEIVRVVDREHVKDWANVKNGIYAKEHALQVFDLVFSGDQVNKGIV